MRELRNENIRFNDLIAKIVLTEDIAESGLAKYEIILSIETKLPDINGLMSKVLHSNDIVEGIIGLSRTSTITRETKAGDSAARLSCTTVRIIPEPIDDYEGIAKQIFNNITMTLKVLKKEADSQK